MRLNFLPVSLVFFRLPFLACFLFQHHHVPAVLVTGFPASFRAGIFFLLGCFGFVFFGRTVYFSLLWLQLYGTSLGPPLPFTRGTACFPAVCLFRPCNFHFSPLISCLSRSNHPAIHGAPISLFPSCFFFFDALLFFNTFARGANHNNLETLTFWLPPFPALTPKTYTLRLKGPQCHFHGVPTFRTPQPNFSFIQFATPIPFPFPVPLPGMHALPQDTPGEPLCLGSPLSNTLPPGKFSFSQRKHNLPPSQLRSPSLFLPQPPPKKSGRGRPLFFSLSLRSDTGATPFLSTGTQGCPFRSVQGL